MIIIIIIEIRFCFPESSIFENVHFHFLIYLYEHFVESVVGLKNFQQFLYKIHKKICLKYICMYACAIHKLYVYCVYFAILICQIIMVYSTSIYFLPPTVCAGFAGQTR